MSVPFDAQAEADVIGVMLMSTRARDICLRALTSADFHSGEAGAAFAAIERLHARGAAVDAATVHADSQVSRRWLLEANANTPASASAAEYVRIVSELAWLRRAQDLGQQLAAAAAAGDVANAESLLSNTSERLTSPRVTVSPAPHVDEVLGRTFEERWLVPNLLERADRVMLTGPEGRGKSTLLRQCAVRLAAGIHPFSDVRVRPAHVLIVDLENSEAQVQRSLQRLVRVAASYTDRALQLWVQCRPQGMDLTNRADVRWLDALLAHHKPDMLVFGSLYKSYRAAGHRSKHSEESAEIVAGVLDELRVRHDCVLLMEAHAGHGDQNDRNGWRPFGASLWLRWPEMGFGLKPAGEGVVELVTWRLSRERGRDWPRQLIEGKRWPWEPVDSEEAAA